VKSWHSYLDLFLSQRGATKKSWLWSPPIRVMTPGPLQLEERKWANQFVLDYKKSMSGVDLKDQLLHSYLTERKGMNKRYMKLFHRLLNTLILNAMMICRSNMGKRIDQLSFRIQLIEGLFVKYVNAVELKLSGRHSSDNTVPHLTERHFISKIPPTVKKSRPQRWCVVCQKRGRKRETVHWCDECGRGLCIECFRDYYTQLNLESNMLPLFIIFISLPCQKYFGSNVDQCSDSIYFSEHSVKIWKTKLKFYPIYYTLSEMLHSPL
jgi:hypothetical protein